MKDDLRFKILEELVRLGHTTEQVSLNKFLSGLKTFNGKSDLGTILEAISELVEDGYVKETRNISVLKSVVTNRNPRSIWKNPERFNSDLTDPKNPQNVAPRIKPVNLFLTLEGKKFLIDWNRLERMDKKSKNENLIKFLFLITGAIISILGQSVVTIIKQSNKEEIQVIKLEDVLIPSSKLDSFLIQLKTDSTFDKMKKNVP